MFLRLVRPACAGLLGFALSVPPWPGNSQAMRALPVGGRRWIVAFGFGLIHGFGFASMLAIVAVCLPVSYWLRRTRIYRRIIFAGGSALIVLVASVWLAERAFVLKLLPG